MAQGRLFRWLYRTPIRPIWLAISWNHFCLRKPLYSKKQKGNKDKCEQYEIENVSVEYENILFHMLSPCIFNFVCFRQSIFISGIRSHRFWQKEEEENLFFIGLKLIRYCWIYYNMVNLMEYIKYDRSR